MFNYQKEGIYGLQELGLTHLTEILEGGVKIFQNKYLSYAPQVNWLDIVKDGTPDVLIEDNGPIKPCNEACDDVPCWGPGSDQCQILKEGYVCDPLCSSDGCWGPGPDQCVSCKNYRRGGTCVPDCMFLTGARREFASPSGDCMPCHPECKVQEGKRTCTGPGADNCVACASLQDGPL